MLKTEMLRGTATHLFSPQSRAFLDVTAAVAPSTLERLAGFRFKFVQGEVGQEKRKETGRFQVSAVEKQESMHGVMEGSTKRARVLDKASAERINAEVADRRESTLMAEDGEGSGLPEKWNSQMQSTRAPFTHISTSLQKMLCSVSPGSARVHAHSSPSELSAHQMSSCQKSARVHPHRSSEARASLNSKGRSQHVAKSVR